jgi:hypothetical protein
MDRKCRILLVLPLAIGSALASAQQEKASEPPWADRGFADFPIDAAESVNGSQATQFFVRASGSNFVPRDSTATFSYSGGGCLQRDSNVGDSWFTYDVQIPDGAVIDFLRVYYYDNNATYDINSELWAFDGAGGTTLIAEADSSGTLGYSSTGSDFFSHTVDTLSESLVVVASIQGGVGDSLEICGIRLRYQLP